MLLTRASIWRITCQTLMGSPQPSIRCRLFCQKAAGCTKRSKLSEDLLNISSFLSARAFLWTVFAFVIFNVLGVTAQNATQTSQSDQAIQKVKDAAQQGFQLSNVSSTDVTNNVSVEATLIPAGVAKTVFGKDVSNNYEVIALTISNRSSDYAFIVNSIFIHYSQWLLGGSSPYGANDVL